MIYICVPAHNEEQTVGVVLWKVRQVMAELARDYQLLVADDGSTDRTPSVLEPYTRVLPLTVFRNEQKRGYAASLEMLLREAVRRSEYPRRDTIVVLQADFTEDPQHVATLIRRIESGADIVASNTVYGEAQPAWRFRWGRALLKRMLRRYPWPDGVRDPLTGLNAYRVFCVKGALDKRSGGRLLQFGGWAANAELLRESAPHARRVDTVELTVRRERLQREERFKFRPLFSEILAFVRGRPSATPSAQQHAADQVFGGRSQYRTLSAESLRETTVTNGARSDATRRAPQRAGRAASERGEARKGRGKSEDQGRPRGRGKAAADAERHGAASAAAGPAEQRKRGEPRRRRGEPSGSTRQEAAAANGGEPAPEADRAERTDAPAKRRPRKRGRRGGTNGPSATAPEGTQEGSSLSAEAASESVRNTADAPFVEAGSEPGSDTPAPRKRRRGSRGGRRRNRPAPGSKAEPNDNDSSSGPEAPPDVAAAG